MRNLIVALLLTLPAFAAPPARAPVVPDKIADQFTPAAFDRQHIEGILGERMRVNLEGRLLRGRDRPDRLFPASPRTAGLGR
jgi:hypothetical protein